MMGVAHAGITGLAGWQENDTLSDRVRTTVGGVAFTIGDTEGPKLLPIRTAMEPPAVPELEITDWMNGGWYWNGIPYENC